MSEILPVGRNFGLMHTRNHELDTTKDRYSMGAKTAPSPTPLEHELSRVSVPLTDSEKLIALWRTHHSLPKLVNSHDSLASLMEQLSNELGDVPETDVGRKIKELLNVATASAKDVLGSRDSLITHLKILPKLLGMHLEHELFRNSIDHKAQESLKPLLLEVIQNSTEAGMKEKAQTLLDRLTGLQLQTSDSGPIQQLLMQYPLNLVMEPREVTIHWEGRRQKDGSIDPNYCRILLVLQLQRLHETTVDIQVQNRWTHIVVYNKYQHLEQLAGPLIPLVKKGMQDLGYPVTQIAFKQLDTPKPTEDSPLFRRASNVYQGMDVLI